MPRTLADDQFVVDAHLSLRPFVGKAVGKIGFYNADVDGTGGLGVDLGWRFWPHDALSLTLAAGPDVLLMNFLGSDVVEVIPNPGLEARALGQLRLSDSCRLESYVGVATGVLNPRGIALYTELMVGVGFSMQFHLLEGTSFRVPCG